MTTKTLPIATDLDLIGKTTPHDINHAVWFAVRHDAYSAQELTNRLDISYDNIDRALKHFQRRGFLRFDGVRYQSARPMGWRYDNDRQCWRHVPLTPPIVHYPDHADHYADHADHYPDHYAA